MTKVDYSKIKDWYTMAGSIMGKGYEEMCHELLDAALEWQEQNPDKDPDFSSLRNVMGYVVDENNDATEMKRYMLNIVNGCSSAQFQQSLSHFYYIKLHGLEKYYDELNSKEEKKQDDSV